MDAAVGDERREVLEGDAVGLDDDVGPADTGVLGRGAEFLLLARGHSDDHPTRPRERHGARRTGRR